METVQMNVIKMPATQLLTTTTVSSQMRSVQEGEQDDSAFAGILHGMTPQAPAQPTVVAGVISAEILSSGVIAGARADQTEKDVEQKHLDDLIPQDVVMNTTLAQSAQAFQMVGRMPKSDQNVDVQVDQVGVKAATLNTAEAMESIQQPITEVHNDNVAEKTSAKVTVETLITPKDVALIGLAATSARAPEEPEVPKMSIQPFPEVRKVGISEKDSMLAEPELLTVTKASMAVPAPRETVVTSAAPQPIPIKVEIQALEPIATQNVSQGNQVTKAEEIPVRTAEFSVLKTQVLQIMEAYSRPAVTISNATAVPVTQHPVETVAAMINSVEAAAVPATQEQGAQKPTSMPVLKAMPEHLQTEVPVSVQKTSEAGAILARTAVKTDDGLAVIKENQQQALATTVVKTSSAENLLFNAVKAVAPATTGDDFGSSDKPTTDQGMNGQVNQLLQQQMKSENVVTASNTAAQVQGNTTGVSEHIARQVSEHLANHEIKTGSEQIVLRLSPENLGELKVNLRMENQRLTVEIVTDNKMVRDALLQHSDTLKDSLAKQNIKMDTFDVSTGSNNSGFENRGQNDWRELARNRQSQQWLASGGYRLPSDLVTPGQQAYLAGTEHSMLDLHF